MLLYTCAGKKFGGSWGHPCGAAAIALDKAGYDYEIKAVRGFKNVPFSTIGGARDKIVELTGQKDVPVLVLDDGTVINGYKTIVAWAKEHPAG